MNGFIIDNNLKITKIFTAFMQHFSPDYKFRGEAHNFYEIVCVIEGSAIVVADDNIFTLKKGEAILHPPMQFHNISNFESKNTTIAVFTFTGDNIPNLNNKICNINDISIIKSLCELSDKYYIKKGYWVIGLKKNNTEHLKFIKNLELFLLSLSINNSKAITGQTQGAINYSLIVKTMDENIHKRLSVSELAKLTNMSEINLQKTFSKYAGVGVKEYFTRIQMRKAEEYLREGKSVKEAALLLGYNDQNYFSTVFKRTIGHTPSHIKI